MKLPPAPPNAQQPVQADPHVPLPEPALVETSGCISIPCAAAVQGKKKTKTTNQPVLFNRSVQRHCPLLHCPPLPNGETEAGGRDVSSLSPAAVLGVMLPAQNDLGMEGVGKGLLGWVEMAANVVPTCQGVPSFGVCPLPNL